MNLLLPESLGSLSEITEMMFFLYLALNVCPFAVFYKMGH